MRYIYLSFYSFNCKVISILFSCEYWKYFLISRYFVILSLLGSYLIIVLKTWLLSFQCRRFLTQSSFLNAIIFVFLFLFYFFILVLHFLWVFLNMKMLSNQCGFYWYFAAIKLSGYYTERGWVLSSSHTAWINPASS